ncbi:MAG: ABC transporter substrate-binding protein [Paracoccaceae bacterium]
MTFLKQLTSRREFTLGAAAGGAGLMTLGAYQTDASDGELETQSIRLIRDRKFPVLCYAPQYVAQRFLELEGFTDVQYVSLGDDGSYAHALVDGTADMSAALGVDWVPPIANGDPIKVLSGLHAGCVEIFANDNVATVQDLQGKRIAVHGLGSPERFLLSSVLAYIGVADTDVEWVFAHPNDWAGMLAGGKIDAMASFPPLNYILHDEGIGHVVLNTTTDNPWKHMFCCMVAANSTFAEENPVAAKRALRAILKANQLCSEQPEVAAKWLVEEGQSPTIDYAMRTLTDLPYDTWDIFDPEDTLRFYALRMNEAGIIDATPETIIANGTDWGPLNEVLKEMKA